ncbi:polymerase [Mojui dos Campos virus]|uniref:RNA-directed RNA polymerase L n=1 Tax=Mojui dos Campos virus TaxID=1543245 RepID=A0A088MJ07_9VIRU|nr:polymerase [Mojui dos Campos virus]
MEQTTFNQFLCRINAAKDASTAKDIDIDLMMARHDYFGKEICRSLGIEYRNDVPLVDIFLDVYPDFDPLSVSIPAVTPDNYYFTNGKLYILDYKVSVSKETSLQTSIKYEQIMADIASEFPINYEIVIIRSNPSTMELSFSSDEFRGLFGTISIELDYTRFFDLKRILYDKFADDEEFILKAAHGDFTLTAPWCKTGADEVYQHPIYREFKFSMPIPYRRLFEESMNFNSYKSERWNTNLINIKEYTREPYEKFVNKCAKYVFVCDDDYPKPTENEIDEGWTEMSKRVAKSRQISTLASDQKPSAHLLWAPPDKNYSNESIDKLLRLSRSLQNIKDPGEHVDSFKAVGKCMDIAGNIPMYSTLCTNRKKEARQNLGHVKNKKLEPVKIGSALVLWEQQFVLNNEFFPKNARILFQKNFFGIGNHRSFKDRNIDDLELDKPKILDFNNESIKLESIKLMESIKTVLIRKNNLDVSKDFIFNYFGEKIRGCNEDTFNNMLYIMNSNSWSSINDISVLMKNILAVSQYNRHNTFRVAMCANNNLYGLIFPSSDIKTKRATVVFCTVVLHKDQYILNPGCLFNTYKTTGGYISISKAIRLDKERCQRIVTSPGLFMLTSLLFLHDNKNIHIENVIPFAFLTSLSITKSLLSLTEPARYMIMNSLAISSNVKGYIEEKFSPYTKTLFSVYVTNLIKKACYKAYSQRDKIRIRDIYFNDYDITQKGVRDDPEFQSIWFPGTVSLKSYLTQIYMPFYFNAKGLHEKHHVMIDLAKTVLDIEMEQRKELLEIWSETPNKQTVNLPVFLHSLSKNLILDTSRHNHLRNKIENRNNFRRSINTISTFTSSKSCIKIGDYELLKKRNEEQRKNIHKKTLAKAKLANPMFYNSDDENSIIEHSNYLSLKNSIPNYVDYISTKVFDRLYELQTRGILEEKPFIEIAMDMMKNHDQFYFTFFNKGQKTAKDREIFVGEFEAKICMYTVERIAKERCKLNPDEMISEPGDGKMKVLEQKSEQEIRFLIENTKQKNRLIDNEMRAYLEDGKQEERIKMLAAERYRGTKIEINADMSKWSAQDVFFKYFWVIALDPILYPEEKERILYFLCKYMQKRLILPDELLCNVFDQRTIYEGDIIAESTNSFNSNWVEIKRNWLQGNFNYISSYVHSCAMSVFKEIYKEVAKLIEGEILINSLVHSDDNQTSLSIIQNRIPEGNLINHSVQLFQTICLTFGCQANMKKTYINNIIKEFVSLFAISGEPFSVFGRFLLTSVGDCAYIGPYEDLASRLTSTQTAIKHGCPPSLAWVSIAVSHWITFTTYNMLPGQVNDPASKLPITNRNEIPIELFGILEADLSTISLVGLESGNLTFLVNLLKKMSDVMDKKSPIIDQVSKVLLWDLNKLSDSDIFKLKLMRYLVLDAELDIDNVMGETSDMRGRSIITPRKFTTKGSLKKLVSYNDYQELMQTQANQDEILEYMLSKPELLVTKGEEPEDFRVSVLHRYNSKKFKESLSIQNPAQLFIEQILFSNKPVIDYSGISDKYGSIADTLFEENSSEISGKMTFPEVYRQISIDLSKLPLNTSDIAIIYNFMILNDPLLTTIANSLILRLDSAEQLRTGLTCNAMPEIRNMKLIKHSPALVLRSYTKGAPDIPGCDPDEMRRDLLHLEEFIEKTNIKNRTMARINMNQAQAQSRDLRFEIKEWTKFYQILYEYIKSTEHKVKIFILPSRAYTSTDFCALIQGNLIYDNKWVLIHYLRPINTGGFKAIIQKTSSSEMNIALECFKLLSYFGDLFINDYSKKQFLNKIIADFTYKNIPVNTLLHMILDSHLRHEFIPILYWTNNLEQRDLDKYDAMKSSEHISWNNWQISRSLNTGPVDLKISGYNREIRIIGEDNKLTIAELQLNRNTIEAITLGGRKLLSSRHGLKLENFERVKFLEPNNFYITYQKKPKNQYSYQIHNTESILRRNEEHSAVKTRIFNEIVPVCPVIISVGEFKKTYSMKKISYLNYDNICLSRLKLEEDEYATIKRAHLHKMQNFMGPEIKTGLLNITELMRTTELLNNSFEKVKNVSMVSISRIIDCSGEGSNDDLEFLSDNPLDFEETEEIQSTPIFNIVFNKRGERHMTYRNALKIAIETQVKEVETAFDFSGSGFSSGENLGCLEVLVSTIKLLETNEWSTIILNSIHIALIQNNLDREYHLFSMPSYFLNDPVKMNINWTRLKDFFLTMPSPNIPMWNVMFLRFKEKALSIIESNELKGRSFNNYISVLRKSGGKGLFEFN